MRLLWTLVKSLPHPVHLTQIKTFSTIWLVDCTPIKKLRVESLTLACHHTSQTSLARHQAQPASPKRRQVLLEVRIQKCNDISATTPPRSTSSPISMPKSTTSLTMVFLQQPAAVHLNLNLSPIQPRTKASTIPIINNNYCINNSNSSALIRSPSPARQCVRRTPTPNCDKPTKPILIQITTTTTSSPTNHNVSISHPISHIQIEATHTHTIAK